MSRKNFAMLLAVASLTLTGCGVSKDSARALLEKNGYTAIELGGFKFRFLNHCKGGVNFMAKNKDQASVTGQVCKGAFMEPTIERD